MKFMGHVHHPFVIEMTIFTTFTTINLQCRAQHKNAYQKPWVDRKKIDTQKETTFTTIIAIHHLWALIAKFIEKFA